MDRQVVEAPDSIAALAQELFAQAERCAQAGLLQQATVVLTQAWSLAETSAPELANVAAWENGWLLLRLGHPDEAVPWFHKVVHPPPDVPLWSATKDVLVQFCASLVRQPTASPYTALPAPLPTTSSPNGTTLPLLEITNLGRFQVARGGQVLPVCGARKAVALLRLLLLRRQRMVCKEELMELLWPDVAARQAAHSLHVTVNALRDYLDPGAATDSYLLFEAGSYRINPAAWVSDDCAQFQQLVSAAEQWGRKGDLDQAQRTYYHALALYQDDYYLGPHVFTWAIAERERLLTCYLQVLDHLGRILMQQNHWELAADCYDRLLACDRYREDAHCQLIRCYWQLGRRATALQQYARCRTILANELGLEPMEETQSLYQAISA